MLSSHPQPSLHRLLLCISPPCPMRRSSPLAKGLFFASPARTCIRVLTICQIWKRKISSCSYFLFGGSCMTRTKAARFLGGCNPHHLLHLPSHCPQQLHQLHAQLHSILQFHQCYHHPMMPSFYHFNLLHIRLKRVGHLLLQIGSVDLRQHLIGPGGSKFYTTNIFIGLNKSFAQRKRIGEEGLLTFRRWIGWPL